MASGRRCFGGLLSTVDLVVAGADHSVRQEKVAMVSPMRADVLLVERARAIALLLRSA